MQSHKAHASRLYMAFTIVA